MWIERVSWNWEVPIGITLRQVSSGEIQFKSRIVRCKIPTSCWRIVLRAGVAVLVENQDIGRGWEGCGVAVGGDRDFVFVNVKLGRSEFCIFDRIGDG